ncbi:transposase [Arthrobacter sp. CAU 1506]|uniref:RNA-guided endonuclease InsQ/TnpB family protein n=1 Tax=Arthrobacter sp. CAU 1506 TaxID=2560052 RepID=UPI0010AC424D|nr:RNA-guided endonuclease TnpB family protein [Arthrobacter sp. CAU 1506]TJY67339.1 transposase [Arthrobacter sp. CAU 1506]
MTIQAVPATTVIRRAYRLTLDPTPRQAQMLSHWAGAARAMYNHSISAKQESHKRWLQEVAFATYGPVALTEEQARKTIRIPIPSTPDFNAWLTGTRNFHREAAGKGLPVPGLRDDGREHEPWLHAVNRSALVGGLRNADRAWNNWMASFKGIRAGRRVGYPRFKKRGVARDSFTITHDRKSPGIRLATTRRLRIPTFGEIRFHDHAKHLQRKIRRGTVEITSVTVSRHGHRWYASLAVEETIPVPRLSKRKRTAGIIGVDLGVHTLAALSNGDLIANPKIKASHARKLARLQKRLARSQKGSRTWKQLVHKIGRLAHLEARQREGYAHDLANRLVKTWAGIGIEDLNVAGMTRSARGTIEKPGRNVHAKAGLNRSILDVAPAQIRRILEYKTAWSGTCLVVIGRFEPTSKKCSACGVEKDKLPRKERIFHCDACGLTLDRDINAAINIAALADVATAELPVSIRRGIVHGRHETPVEPPRANPFPTRAGNGRRRNVDRPARVIFAQ